MSIITMYDSVDLNQFPSNPEAVAGYVGGLWPTESPLVLKFPHARHKSVAVNASEDADILDIENGDAVPADAPAWFNRQKARGAHLPGFYADLSTMPSVIDALNRAGIARNEYTLWLAHYTGVQPAAPFELGVDAVQFTDHSMDRNLDQSVTIDSFWGTSAPPIKNTVHYDWFDKTPRRVFLKKRTEFGQVQLYDRLRAQQTPTSHPHRLQLWFIRKVLKWFAGRVADVAIKQQPLANHKPSWGVDHRGWRYQQLTHRSQGARLV
jgi:hypothetical protein